MARKEKRAQTKRGGFEASDAFQDELMFPMEDEDLGHRDEKEEVVTRPANLEPPPAKRGFFHTGNSSPTSSENSEDEHQSSDDDDGDDDLHGSDAFDDLDQLEVDGMAHGSLQEFLEQNLGLSPHDDEPVAMSERFAGGSVSQRANEQNVSKASSNPSRVPSRYTENFVEEGVLGRGGFGEVVKARNKLDGLFYGIKKVKISTVDSRTRRKILREVVTIARLHHQFIVRYFQAWIEWIDLDSSSTAPGSTLSTFDDDSSWMRSSSQLAEDEFDITGSRFSPKQPGQIPLTIPNVKSVVPNQIL